jgi:hypothetical protein
MTPTDDQILDLLADAETLCDAEVARGDYAGCSTDLELAFADYEARAVRLLAAAGGR